MVFVKMCRKYDVAIPLYVCQQDITDVKGERETAQLSDVDDYTGRLGHVKSTDTHTHTDGHTRIYV